MGRSDCCKRRERGLKKRLAGDEAKALAAGYNAYITKPYSPRALLAKVREYLP
jgi:DNA-binding response OmpR family regulator